ncbi:MAG: hypothetical protein GAK29_00982 [Acinetobacter bereziniae]|uniref:Uncharacterized protein n=1 Tax=Acinetobacter bereziniae TaxID=106648 RepID=A0A833URM3_ACIBZ|nr:MAG: hypothetical protein GAK29_00982 [Acinetobacter bereziniae]
MLQFTDLTNFKHFVDLEKITNVVIRPQNPNFVTAFHFECSQVFAATVNQETVNSIQQELENHGSTQHAL